MTERAELTDALAARFKSPGPKRILTIDGGGVRGALAIGMLSKLERTLRDKLGRPDLVLADYFDLIGGTSTGAIIAAGLALGRDCANLDALYRRMGPSIFGAKLRVPMLQAKFNPLHLQRVLEQELGHDTLGSAPWRTGFAAIAKRVDTGSPWVLTNNPHSKYWSGDPDELARVADEGKRVIVANRDYPVARVVQASAAAPFYFDLVQIEVLRGQRGIFFDGGVSPHNNPTLQLAMAALAPAYGFGWAAGGDNLMVVSVGTGQARPHRPEWVGRRVLAILKATWALLSVNYDSSQFGIAVMQWLGQSPQPWRLNSEVGSLSEPAAGSSMSIGVGPGAPMWTFVRYDAPLDAAWLESTLGSAPTAKLLKAYSRLDGAPHIPVLLEMGAAVGERIIDAAHFPPVFDPPPPAS